MEAKIAAMKKRHQELCAQIKKVEAEQAAAVNGHAGAAGAISAKEQGVDQAEGSVEAAKARAALEEKEAAAAAKKAALAKERLAAAEAAMKGGPTGLDAEAAKLKQEYEMAKETYTKEANDVKAAQKRVDMAKAELAKWEPHSSARAAAPIFTAVLLAAVSSL